MTKTKFISLTLFCLSACSPGKQINPTLVRMERDQSSLRSEQEQLRRQVADLSNTILVLQDRLETMKAVLDRKSPETKTSASKKKQASVAPASSERSVTEHEEPFLIANDPRDSRLPTLQLSNRDLDRTEQRRLEKKEVAESDLENPEATQLYNAGFQKFEEGKYLEAIADFEKFVSQFRTHSYADNAVYWTGESLLKMNQVEQAVRQFERVVAEFPQGNKVPDALLRAGDCYVKLAREREARQSFQRVVDQFPQSVAAEKARSWLKGRTS